MVNHKFQIVKLTGPQRGSYDTAVLPGPARQPSTHVLVFLLENKPAGLPMDTGPLAPSKRWDSRLLQSRDLGVRINGFKSQPFFLTMGPCGQRHNLILKFCKIDLVTPT